MRTASISLPLLLLVGCGARASLSASEQARFDDCRAHVRPTVCEGSPPYSRRCLERERATVVEYAALSPAERSRWLRGRGCPAAVVAYSEPRAPSTEARPPSATTRARASVTVDEFTQVRSARFAAPLWPEGERRSFAEIRVQFVEGATVGQIALSALNERPVWGGDCDVAMLIDDAPAALGDPEYRRLEGSESYVMSTGEGVLARLLAARSVRVRVCDEALRVRDAALEDLRGLQPASSGSDAGPTP